MAFDSFAQFGSKLLKAGYELRNLNGPVFRRGFHDAGEEFVHIFKQKIENQGATPFGGSTFEPLSDATIGFRDGADTPLIATHQYIDSIQYEVHGHVVEVGVNDGPHPRSYELPGASGDSGLSNSQLAALFETGASYNPLHPMKPMPPRPVFTDHDFPAIASSVMHKFSHHVITNGFVRKLKSQ